MTIDPRFIEKAQELAFAFSPGQSTDLRHTIAIARALQDARDGENRECETIASDTANSCEGGAGYYDAAAATADAIADRIAARRGPGL